jgi:hypothetical protein
MPGSARPSAGVACRAKAWFARCAAVHVELPIRANVLRLHRDPIDPDFFLYYVGLWDGGAFHLLEFRVNDVSAPGFLFVVRLKHTV